MKNWDDTEFEKLSPDGRMVDPAYEFPYDMAKIRKYCSDNEIPFEKLTDSEMEPFRIKEKITAN